MADSAADAISAIKEDPLNIEKESESAVMQ